MAVKIFHTQSFEEPNPLEKDLSDHYQKFKESLGDSKLSLEVLQQLAKTKYSQVESALLYLILVKPKECEEVSILIRILEICF